MKPHDVILESAKPAELLSACPKYKPTPLLKSQFRIIQSGSKMKLIEWDLVRSKP